MTATKKVLDASGKKDRENQCSKGLTGGRLVYTWRTRKVKGGIPVRIVCGGLRV